MNLDAVRNDFPFFQETSNGKPIIYLDSACQSLRPRSVVEAMNEYYLRYPACSGRSYHKLASQVTQKCDEARSQMARFLGAAKRKRSSLPAIPPRESTWLRIHWI